MKKTFTYLKSCKERVLVGIGTTSVAVMGVAGVAHADATTPVANTAVTGAFADAAADVGATIGVVGAAGVAIMIVFLAWRYGRKIFSSVAK